MESRKEQLKNAAILAGMQFLNWGICTISWRAVAQANIMASVITDTTLASLQFFLLKRVAKSSDDQLLIPWLGYTLGGVLGTVTGVYSSIFFLGK